MPNNEAAAMSEEQFQAPLVDSHAHVYTLDMPLDSGAWHKPPHDANIEQYIETLDRHGVRYAVLAAASLFGTYNDYQIDACRKHARLRTTAIIAPTTERYIMERMRENGVVGVRFQRRNNAAPPDLNSPEYRLLLRRIRDLDWHVQLHDEGAQLPPAIAAIEAAGVKLVIDHFGRPTAGLGIQCPGFQAVLRSIERGKTWVKLSGGFRLGTEKEVIGYATELLRIAGPERLLWGSDWPFAAFESTMRYQQTIESFAKWVPDPVLRQRIGGETALDLYFK